MLAILVKLIPIRDWLYAGLAIAAMVFWFHHDHVEQAAGAARVTAAVAKASAEAEKAAAAQIALLETQHAADAAKVKEVYDTALTTAAAQHAADLDRLRSLTAHRADGGGPVLESSGAGSSTSDGGTGSLAELGTLAATLADALRRDDAALSACYVDRDSLTGK
jgi:membrane protein involved in colicin uptake